MTQTDAGRAGLHPLRRAGAGPLWQQLETDLERRLAAGEFTGRLPTEAQLMAAYGVSRHTVREALRRLRADGRLASYRGRGSFVQAFEQRLGALYSLFRLVEATGAEQRSVVRLLDQRSDPIAAGRLGLPGDAPLVHLERLRLADGEPLALDRAWLPATIAGPLLAADFSHTALYDELTDRCNVRPTEARELIHAVQPPARDRRLLRLPPGTAAFLIERTSRDGGRPVEFRHSLVRGDRFRLLAEWSGRTGLRLDMAATQSEGSDN